MIINNKINQNKNVLVLFNEKDLNDTLEHIIQVSEMILNTGRKQKEDQFCIIIPSSCREPEHRNII